MFSSIRMDYSQTVLIDRINRYQQLKGRPLISTRGYCHGLAIVWLSKMAEQKIAWFNDTVKHLIHTRPEDYDEVRLEKFLAQIEFGQNPLNSSMNITQRHLRIIFEMNNIESIGFMGAYPSLYKKIRRKKHPAMYLITRGDHAIAVFQHGDAYHVYDSNYTSGEAKTFNSKERAADEIMARLLPAEKKVKDAEFDLELNYIPLMGYLSHPTVEVTIDMPGDESGYEADEELSGDSPSWGCTIL